MDCLGEKFRHFVLSLVTLSLVSCGSRKDQSLLFYCAASQRVVMDEVLALYQEEGEGEIHVQYGGSGAMRAQLELAGGDLFLPADISYLSGKDMDGFESRPLVRLTPVIIVRQGNPLGIKGVSDFKEAGLRLCFGDSSTAIGKATHQILEQRGVKEEVLPQVVVERPSVVGVAETLELGAVDAAVVWNVTAELFRANCEIVPLEDAARYSTIAAIAVCSQDAKKRQRATEFVNFLLTDKRVRALYLSLGYKWAE